MRSCDNAARTGREAVPARKSSEPGLHREVIGHVP